MKNVFCLFYQTFFAKQLFRKVILAFLKAIPNAPLMSLLRTFKLNQETRQKENPSVFKEKLVALKCSRMKNSNEDNGENEMALLTKNFEKMRQEDWKQETHVQIFQK